MTDPASLLAPSVWFVALAGVLGLIFVAYLRIQIAGAVGAVRHASRPTMGGRRFQLGVALVGLLALVGLNPLLVLPSALGLAAALAIGFLRPGFEDSAFGESGVQRGWFARRYTDLDEWRLTGEHLRWKLYGDWQATEVPTSEHAELRARLEAAIPERESSFQR